MLTLEINDLEEGMFSKTMKLTDTKQESSEYKAKEQLNSGDKQEWKQIRSLCNRIIVKEMHLRTKMSQKGIA